jgi:hypothetical protein
MLPRIFTPLLNCSLSRALSALSEGDFSETRRMLRQNKYVMYFIHVSRTFFIRDSGRCKSDCCSWWPSSHKRRYISEFHKTFSLSPESFRPSSCCPACSAAIRLTNSYFWVEDLYQHVTSLALSFCSFLALGIDLQTAQTCAQLYMKVIKGKRCNASTNKYTHTHTYECVNIYIYIYIQGGPGSSVGIATGNGLGGPGIESRWGARFFAQV